MTSPSKFPGTPKSDKGAENAMVLPPLAMLTERPFVGADDVHTSNRKVQRLGCFDRQFAFFRGNLNQ